MHPSCSRKKIIVLNFNMFVATCHIMYRTNLNDNYPPDELNAANGTELPPLRVNQRTSDAGHSSEHVVEIPTTPRGDERGMDIAPPIKGQLEIMILLCALIFMCGLQVILNQDNFYLETSFCFNRFSMFL